MSAFRNRTPTISILLTTSVLLLAGLVAQTFSFWYRRVTYAAPCSCESVSGVSIPPDAIFGYLTTAIFIFSAWRMLHLWVRTRGFSSSLTVVAPSPPVRKVAESLGLAQRVQEYRGRYGVFCAGFFRPKIFISSAVAARLSSEELRAVIEHESVHLHRHDPLRLAVISSVSLIFEWLPWMRTLSGRIRTEMELTADAEVMRRSACTPALGSSLLKLLPLDGPAAEGSLSFSGSTASRIDQLLGHPVQRAVPLVAVITLVILSFGLATSVLALNAFPKATSTRTVAGFCRQLQHWCSQPPITAEMSPASWPQSIPVDGASE